MPFIVKLRHGCSKGHVLGTVGPFATKDLAVEQAQALADDSAKGIVVVVEKTSAKRKANPRRNAKWGRLVKTIGTVKVYRDSEWDEYVVVPPGAKEAQVYRTDDREDAYDTAKAMAGARANPSKAPVKTRKFGGDVYQLDHVEVGKATADRAADKLRLQHGRARVVPFTSAGQTYYALYYRNQRSTTRVRRVKPKPQQQRLLNTRKGGPTMLIYKGHAVEKRGAKYVVLPYGWEYKTQKAAKGAITKHVAGTRRPNRKPAKPRKIRRKGYWRTLPAGQYGTDPKGRRVKGRTWVKGKLIEDRGGAGRGPQTLPPITEGGLGGAGYTDKPARTRHGILRRVVTAEGYKTALGRVQLLERYGANTMGAKALRVLASDRAWLVKTFGGPGSFGPREGPKKTRKIDGKVYKLSSLHRAKRTATENARKARAAGSLARVVSFGNQWALYTR